MENRILMTIILENQCRRSKSPQNKGSKHIEHKKWEEKNHQQNNEIKIPKANYTNFQDKKPTKALEQKYTRINNLGHYHEFAVKVGQNKISKTSRDQKNKR